MKGDKVVAFCDRNCNVIAPFVPAPGNRNEAPLLREALPQLTQTALAIGLDLRGTIVSLDGVYDCRANRKAIFNRGMKPNINLNPRGRKTPKRSRKPLFAPAIFDERFRTVERVFAWEVPPPAAALRASESPTLRVQDARLHDDQSAALLPQPNASSMTGISSSVPCAGISFVPVRPEYLNHAPGHRVLTLHSHRIFSRLPPY
ncbi:hypothetical protein [Paraburkholderia aromaticivorans]|uniref:hypothetical protein n=1 Tax=Paraburkholderia aromaticivorans TaxID=2026199 RepID=UPI001F0FDD7E|nr:hypothetical protein [Paraburkholderia aromaticivorans]